MGRRVPEVDHESLRELIVEGYRVLYQLREERIEIITVVHSRQDLPRKFRRRG
ncbi:type II toxin-antitoxin system RelE/ParE family toxin [Salinibacter ruber]